jgi:hypothetical protein
MKMKYSHPAIAPESINISTLYEVDELIKLGIKEEMIEVLFTEVTEETTDIKKK